MCILLLLSADTKPLGHRVHTDCVVLILIYATTDTGWIFGDLLYTGYPSQTVTVILTTRKKMSLEDKLLTSGKTKQTEPEDRLTRLIKRENEVVQEIKTTFDLLKSLMARVRTEGVKEQVEKMGTLLDELIRKRGEIKLEHRGIKADEKTKAETFAGDKTTLHRVTVAETRILEALKAVNKRMDNHEEQFNKLASNNYRSPETQQPSDRPDVQWTEVVRRRKPNKIIEDNDIQGKPEYPTKMTKPGKTARVRPMAIVVANEGQQFPELLKTIRKNVNPDVTGDAIMKMRETQNGKLLIEINGGAGPTETVRAEVARSMGPKASVRVLEDKSPVEILDLDAETTTHEVTEALAGHDGGAEARVVSLRKAYGRSQTAVILLPSAAAARLCKAGRMRVGLVYARVRHTELKQRCFKCLNFNHMARECVGRDRTGQC